MSKRFRLEEVPDGTILWKYMSLAKFILMLQTRTLHFRRIDKYNDNKEGALTTLDEAWLQTRMTNLSYWKKDRCRYYASCWIASSHELALMWDTYGKNGVAIRTTAQKLKSIHISPTVTPHLCYVKYINPDNGSVFNEGEPVNAYMPIISKRHFFEQEKEVRLFFHVENRNGRIDRLCKIDVEFLIDTVVIHPHATKSFDQLVNREVAQYGLKLNIQSSEI